MKRFFRYSTIIFCIAVFFSAELYAEKVYDPNDGKSKAYPDKEKKEKKGSGKYTEFDKKKAKNKKVFDPNKGTTTGYPDANITEIRKSKKGTGKSVIFSDGPVEYPDNYKNPLDSVPMEKKEDSGEKKREWKISSEDLPKNVCPLTNERRTFNAYNRQNREDFYYGMMVGRPFVVVRTSQPDLGKPSLLQGGIVLQSTVFDRARNSWVANMKLAPQYKCGSNTVQVHQDDSFTPEMSVLEVGENIVILLVDGKLAYLRPKGSHRPDFRMVWDTGLEVEFEKNVDSSPKATKRSKAKKVKKRKPSVRRSKKR